ncbi:OmpA family protein [uncultured Cytophaga sp.]|uniref:OmpA family protein n=1 Tax=uncultured Cytophaga sp. TaxID=160238 RepID=UPI00262F20D1|nr:OmpA family protein [uncultured Cytophaga sp.]
MKYVSLSIVFILSIFTISLFAQNREGIDKNLSLSKMKARAKIAYQTGDVYSALFYYEEVVKLDTTDIKTLYLVADMYRFTRNYTLGAVTYEKVFLTSPTEYPLALYYQALMLKMCGKYEEAKTHFIEFKKISTDMDDKVLKAKLNRELTGCDSGMVYRDFPENVKIKNVGNSVNYPHIEFSPVIMDSTRLAFGSLRMDSVEYYDTRGEHYQKPPVRQLYEAKKINGEWVEQGMLESINDTTVDMGNFVYSPYSKRFYFTKCTKSTQGKVSCEIYYTEKVSGSWSKPSKLPAPINIPGYTSTQPTIVIDTASTSQVNATAPTSKNMPPRKTGSTRPVPKPKVNQTEYLYFVSDRPEGKGGLDIWYTSYNETKNVWNKAVNFTVANTSETDCTPFFHVPSQTFYYSTDGLINAGGLDIYKIQKDGRRFLRPENLSFPINSPQDELSFVLADDGKNGFLVSNRPGGTPFFHETCCDDIYSLEIIPAPPFVCELDLSVLTKDNNCVGELLTIQQKDTKTSLNKSDTIRLADCAYNLALSPNTNYAIFIHKKGFVNDTLFVETKEMCSSPILKRKLEVIAIDTIKVVPFMDEKPVIGKPFVLKDIQYASDVSDLNEVSQKVINDLLIPFLMENPDVNINVSSHTDDLGSNKYNEDLSERRASKVKKYLISKGIAANRIQAKGYGEYKPLASNTNPDGSVNEDGRSINRRTEFFISK